jgi:hypothetical protein
MAFSEKGSNRESWSLKSIEGIPYFYRQVHRHTYRAILNDDHYETPDVNAGLPTNSLLYFYPIPNDRQREIPQYSQSSSSSFIRSRASSLSYSALISTVASSVPLQWRKP